MGAAHKTRVTAAEYLAMERAAKDKHELWDGEVFAMAGARMVHNRLVIQVGSLLTGALRGRPCFPLASDMRVRVPGGDRYVYPDVTVACRPVELEDAEQDVLLNPRVVFEILSESTERFDRGAKFAGYRQIGSLTDYVLVSTDRRLLEHYRRQSDGSWLYRAAGDGERLLLDSLGAELAVDEVYADVELAREDGGGAPPTAAPSPASPP